MRGEGEGVGAPGCEALPTLTGSTQGKVTGWQCRTVSSRICPGRAHTHAPALIQVERTGACARNCTHAHARARMHAGRHSRAHARAHAQPQTHPHLGLSASASTMCSTVSLPSFICVAFSCARAMMASRASRCSSYSSREHAGVGRGEGALGDDGLAWWSLRQSL